MTNLPIARIPYLNSVPFFRGLPFSARYKLSDCVPRELGARAAAGQILAGLLPVADWFRLHGSYERLGHFGIAVRGRSQSVLLFSRKPMRQLEGANITVTEDTSTSLLLLRLLLEKRYQILPAGYDRRERAEKRSRHRPSPNERRQAPEADALLLIGDEALKFRKVNTQYPFETDLAFEWWLWQHLPFVFAVWVIRKDVAAQERKQIEAGLAKSLAGNLGHLDAIALECAPALGVPEAELKGYLGSFLYRLGPQEEEGIKRFEALLHEHHLL